MKSIRKLANFLAACVVAAAALLQPAAAQELSKDPFITKNADRANFEPGGQYHLFGSPRGSVANRTGNIDVRQVYSHQTGNLLIQQANISGTIGYETHFSGHGHEVHSPFDNHASRSASDEKGSVSQGFTVYRLNWSGHEHHPADGYDGPQGGGYPAPTGARDEYTYKVDGIARSIKLNPQDTRNINERFRDNYANLGSNFSKRANEANKKMFDHNPNLSRWGNTMEFVNGVAAGALNPFQSAAEAVGLGDALYGAGYAIDKATMYGISPLSADGKLTAIGAAGGAADFENRTREEIDRWIQENPNAAETAEAVFNAAVAAKAAKMAKSAKAGKAEVGDNFSDFNQSRYTSQTAENIINADRVGSGLKADPSHRSASFLSKEQLESGKTFSITGGDGIQRTLLQTKGALNDQQGIYEYIIDSNKNVTHQRFIKGGEITGQPNQRVKK